MYPNAAKTPCITRWQGTVNYLVALLAIQKVMLWFFDFSESLWGEECLSRCCTAAERAMIRKKKKKKKKGRGEYKEKTEKPQLIQSHNMDS